MKLAFSLLTLTLVCASAAQAKTMPTGKCFSQAHCTGASAPATSALQCRELLTSYSLSSGSFGTRRGVCADLTSPTPYYPEQPQFNPPHECDAAEYRSGVCI